MLHGTLRYLGKNSNTHRIPPRAHLVIWRKHAMKRGEEYSSIQYLLFRISSSAYPDITLPSYNWLFPLTSAVNILKIKTIMQTWIFHATVVTHAFRWLLVYKLRISHYWSQLLPWNRETSRCGCLLQWAKRKSQAIWWVHGPEISVLSQNIKMTPGSYQNNVTVSPAQTYPILPKNQFFGGL